MDAKDADIAQLKGVVAAQDTHIEDLETNVIPSQDEEIANLKHQIRGLRSQLETRSSKSLLADRDQHIEYLEKELTAQKHTIESRENTITQLRNQVQGLEDHTQALDDWREHLEQRLEKCQEGEDKKMLALEVQVQDSGEMIRALVQENEQLQDRLRRRDVDISELTDSLRLMVAEIPLPAEETPQATAEGCVPDTTEQAKSSLPTDEIPQAAPELHFMETIATTEQIEISLSEDLSTWSNSVSQAIAAVKVPELSVHEESIVLKVAATLRKYSKHARFQILGLKAQLLGMRKKLSMRDAEIKALRELICGSVAKRSNTRDVACETDTFGLNQRYEAYLNSLFS